MNVAIRTRPDGAHDQFRCVPGVDAAILGLVLSFAIWTIYCHLITLAHASFDELMRWLALEVLVTLTVLVCWFRRARVRPTRLDDDGADSGIENTLGNPLVRHPVLALLLAAAWVGLLFAGMPYAVFWWAP